MGSKRKLWIRITAIAVTALMVVSAAYMAIAYIINLI